MAKTYFNSYIRKINGQLVYCVQGKSNNPTNHKNRHIECYRMFENGMYFCRNLYINNFTHGYFCIYPGEKFSYYRGGEKLYAYTEDWCIDSLREIGCYNQASKRDIDLITSVYPNFIYTYKKMLKVAKPTLYGVFQALQIWKKHKEIEFFFACGLYAHAFTKNIYKLSKAKQLQLCKYCYAHKEVIQTRAIDYRELQSLIKYNITEEKKINEFLNFLRDNPKFRTPEHLAYLKRQIEKKNDKNETISSIVQFYKDYYKLCVEIDNNMKDPYHKNPSNLFERHKKVLKQAEEVRKVKEALRQEQLRREEEERKIKAIERQKEILVEMQKKSKKYLAVVKKYFKFNSDDFMGYSIFIPSTINEISEQAEKLGQCLIRCDYVSSVINRRCVLVFMRSAEGEPLATAEINPSGKISQFRGIHNNVVDEDKTIVFNKWLESHPIRIRQYHKKAA